AGMDHRVEAPVGPFDARDRGVDELPCTDLPRAHQLCLSGGGEPKQIVGHGRSVNRSYHRCRPMRVLAAIDKFRGTVTAAEAAAAVGRGVARAGGTATALPLADGGEGTLDVLGGG